MRFGLIYTVRTGVGEKLVDGC